MLLPLSLFLHFLPLSAPTVYVCQFNMCDFSFVCLVCECLNADCGPSLGLSTEQVHKQASHCNDKKTVSKRVQELSSELFFGVFVKVSSQSQHAVNKLGKWENNTFDCWKFIFVLFVIAAMILTKCHILFQPQHKFIVYEMGFCKHLITLFLYSLSQKEKSKFVGVFHVFSDGRHLFPRKTLLSFEVLISIILVHIRYYSMDRVVLSGHYGSDPG